MHFVKDHLGEFKGDLSLKNEEGLKALRLQADEQLALTLQGKDMEVEEEGGGEDKEKEEEERRILATVNLLREEGFPSSRTTVMKKRKSSRSSSSSSNTSRSGSSYLPGKSLMKKKKRARSGWSDEDEEDGGLFGPREGGRERGKKGGEEEEEEEGWAVEGPTTRSGTTIVYRPTHSPSTSLDAGILSSGGGGREGGRALPVSKPLESDREMEARKKRRLELLVERTTAIHTRLEEGIASLLPAAAAAEGEGGREKWGEGLPEVVLEGRVLRDYQKVGLSWLLSLHKNELNGILADEMVRGEGREGGGGGVRGWCLCVRSVT